MPVITRQHGRTVSMKTRTAAGPMLVPFVDLRQQHSLLADEIQQMVRRVLEAADFIRGSCVAEFEGAFGALLDARHVVGASSGLDALRIALQALDVGPGDDVIMPANTFIATALAASAVGARPVLVDCDESTFNIDARGVAGAISSRTRAIVPVHLCGQAADLGPLLDLAEAHRLYLIEDAAQAQGTRYKGRAAGTIGTVGCFSFYPSKNLGAIGDGGAIVTNDEALAARARRIANYGANGKYEHVEKGLNARLDTVQAGVLTIKLRHLSEWNRRRADHAGMYDALLADVDSVQTPFTSADSTHIYHLYTLRAERRDELRRYLTDRGIETGIHYPIPIHQQPAYRELGYQLGDCPVAVRLSREVLSLPMFPELTREQIHYVCESVRRFYTTNGQP
jgi:dTDP-4-amino-4,6-dideoxygalactose transaminase